MTTQEENLTDDEATAIKCAHKDLLHTLKAVKTCTHIDVKALAETVDDIERAFPFVCEGEESDD